MLLGFGNYCSELFQIFYSFITLVLCVVHVCTVQHSERSQRARQLSLTEGDLLPLVHHFWKPVTIILEKSKARSYVCVYSGWKQMKQILTQHEHFLGERDR